MAVFASRQIVMPVLSVVVTITGSGNSRRCYVTINGTKQYKAGTYDVNAGDTITFGVYGYSKTYYGEVKIEGTQVLKVTEETTKTYEWTVPSGIRTVTIAMTYTSTSSRRNGKIAVTTE